MLESILAEIDTEIERLQEAKRLLSVVGAVAGKRGPGRPAKTEAPTPAKTSKRRTMSAEARERIQQAQIKRWAETKKAAKQNLNATVAPPPKAEKKAAKSA